MAEAQRPVPLPPAFTVLAALTNPWLDDDGGRTAAAAVAAGGFDWADVLAHARRHRVGPFLAHRLDSLGLMSEPPPGIAAALRQEGQLAGFHEMAMLSLVRSLNHAFHEAGIDFLILKGLVLSSSCYGRMGLRVNRDIDVLVAPAELERAHATLARMGFARIEPPGEPSAEELGTWPMRKKDWVYSGPPAGTVIELHHRLFDNRALSDGKTEISTRRVNLFEQIEVSTLDQDDELAYLALHGALHAWSRLKWLLDLAFIFRELGPQAVSAALDRHGRGPAARALRQAVALCVELFGVEPAPTGKRSWMDALLVSAARHAMTGAGAVELEASRFGTTLKNASHYLLWQRPSYLASELAYDLTDLSRDGDANSGNIPKWFSRPALWVARHWGGTQGGTQGGA